MSYKILVSVGVERDGVNYTIEKRDNGSATYYAGLVDDEVLDTDQLDYIYLINVILPKYSDKNLRQSLEAWLTIKNRGFDLDGLRITPALGKTDSDTTWDYIKVEKALKTYKEAVLNGDVETFHNNLVRLYKVDFGAVYTTSDFTIGYYFEYLNPDDKSAGIRILSDVSDEITIFDSLFTVVVIKL